MLFRYRHGHLQHLCDCGFQDPFPLSALVMHFQKAALYSSGRGFPQKHWLELGSFSQGDVVFLSWSSLYPRCNAFPGQFPQNCDPKPLTRKPWLRLGASSSLEEFGEFWRHDFVYESTGWSFINFFKYILLNFPSKIKNGYLWWHFTNDLKPLYSKNKNTRQNGERSELE